MKDKSDFLLDPTVIFLNHGSFGACPKPVFEAYQSWQLSLEQQPVLFLSRKFAALLKDARQALGEYLNAAPDDLVYVSNATYGVNIVARSLALEPGDEILTSNHEYGACDKIWQFICRKTGAKYIRQPIHLPLPTPETFVEQLWQAVTPRTKLIYLSHITSPTAQCFPVELICQRAREDDIPTLIDGAHAPGHIPLDLSKINADFYTGNCHKWMLSPKGAGFLYVRSEVQRLVEPLVVSWGYEADEKFSTGSRFIDYLEWSGTSDPSAALAVPTAIQFMENNDWEHVRLRCNALLQQALDRIGELTSLPSLYSNKPNITPHSLPPQMGVAPLPQVPDLGALKTCLYDDFHIEVPLIDWNGRFFIRISVQAYNTQHDIDVLIQALRNLLPDFQNR